MRNLALFLCTVLIFLLLTGCSSGKPTAQVAATTLPVYTFTSRLCDGTGIAVTRLVTESVSCLHDYTLQVGQMRAIEGAEVVVISGGGLEEFLEDALTSAHAVIDSSEGLNLLEGESHDHLPEREENHAHVHQEDPHIWLSPANAKIMAQNICQGLCKQFPASTATFEANLACLLQELDALQAYGESQLSSLSCRELITFHDGFSYFAESFDLTIIKAVEEESGSEASAGELIELIGLVRERKLPAIFTECNGSDAAAGIIASETGVKVYVLDMAMSGDDYFKAMYHNIDTIKEALQ